jgi:hypothetical protein
MFDKHNKAMELLALIDAFEDSEVKYILYCELQKWIKDLVRNNISKQVQEQKSPPATIS